MKITRVSVFEIEGEQRSGLAIYEIPRGGLASNEVEKQSPHLMQPARFFRRLQLPHQNRFFEWTAVPFDRLDTGRRATQHLREGVGDEPAWPNPRSFGPRRRPHRCTKHTEGNCQAYKRCDKRPGQASARYHGLMGGPAEGQSDEF